MLYFQVGSGTCCACRLVWAVALEPVSFLGLQSLSQSSRPPPFSPQVSDISYAFENISLQYGEIYFYTEKGSLCNEEQFAHKGTLSGKVVVEMRGSEGKKT